MDFGQGRTGQDRAVTGKPVLRHHGQRYQPGIARRMIYPYAFRQHGQKPGTLKSLPWWELGSHE